MTRPTGASYLSRREELLEAGGALFKAIESGAIKVQIGQRFALKDAADAHRALEDRKTVGSTVLIP